MKPDIGNGAQRMTDTETIRSSMKRKRRTKAEMAAIRDRALEHIKAVPYRVSLRWVFYRLLQDGLYGAKGDYTDFKNAAASWRHSGEWPPDIIDDDQRQVIYRGRYDGRPPAQAALQMIEALEYMAQRSHFHEQPYYVEIWYEARAMTAQFKYYTKGITLRPFAGDYSIQPKYQTAKDIEDAWEQFGKPIKILYFGDRDDKGETIDYNATFGKRGLAKWCDVDFDVIRGGLTSDQALRFDLPVNPDKPTEYQWESLTDPQARELITETSISTPR